MANEKTAKQAEVNIGMIGHVDHGKTSLTQALTGKWTDTHSEELKRGISIRLGYADAGFYRCKHCKDSTYTNKLSCPNCGKKAELLRIVSFVDAPGHETLMTTMLSGAALMQGAILVIAANEPCPQPQTEEHLMALRIAGISSIVVAQNKIDLVSKKEALENKKQILQFLEKHGYKNVPVIPIAAHFGINLDLLIGAIEKNIKTPKYELKKPLKMYCARSFDINKPGTKPAELKGGVVGGSIIQGIVKEGDKIALGPGVAEKELQTSVVSLSTVLGKLQKAVPGGLVAIGTQLDPSMAQNDRLKGQIISKPGTMPSPTDSIALEVHYIERLVADVKAKINVNEFVVLTIGTMTAAGTVTAAHGNKIKLDTKLPIVVESGQKVALSKKVAGRWRLIAYGIAE